jgi:hypothetical protein
MLKLFLAGNGAPRDELDRRAREARMRQERLERLLLPRVKVRGRRLRRGLRLLAAAIFGGVGGGRIGTPQSDRMGRDVTAPDTSPWGTAGFWA